MNAPGPTTAWQARLPDRSPVALTVMRLTDDPDACAIDLAQAIGADAVFTARILRVANSPYYGLAAGVSSLLFAVSVLGFHTIKALAVVAATGLDTPTAAPAQFWQAAATTASASEHVAPILGADPGDAFCLGLLHTLGAAVLHQQQPLPRLCLPLPAHYPDTARAEENLYGISHDQAGAQLLESWHFPQHITTLIARHHEPLLPDASPLERTLHLARTLTHHLLTENNPPDPDPDPDSRTGNDDNGNAKAPSIAWLTQGRLSDQDTHPLLNRLRESTPHLLESLQPGSS